MPRMLLDIPDDKFLELVVLAEKLGLDDASDVLSNSFSLFRWAVQQTEKGAEVCAEYGKELEYVNVPCLVKLQKKINNHKPEVTPIKGAHLKVVK
jgi:hypothetical protein